MAHGNINPKTILTATKAGPQYVLDISHLCQMKNIRETAGPNRAICYSSPESTRTGEFTPASDVYSFGVVLLGVLGLWCINEGFSDQNSWRKKLQACGVKGSQEYEDDRARGVDLHPLMEPTHSRIRSLVRYGIVGSELGRLLEESPHRRPSAAEARAKLLKIYPSS